MPKHTVNHCSLFEIVKPPFTSLKFFSTRIRGISRNVSIQSLAFSQIIASDTLSPANCFSLIQTIKNFSTSSTAGSLLLVKGFTPFATSAAVMASLFFSMFDIVD